MAEVKLYGAWTSPFNGRVIWALKLKGIPFEFVQEDLRNKSALLLQYNPIHKKIPVLVHGGKPVCESMVILEYIEETWPQNPLLPTDPYDRAQARFWVKFVEDKGFAIRNFLLTTGQEQEKAMKDLMEILETAEQQGLGGKKFFLGDKVGIVDIAFGSIFYWLEVVQDVLGVRLYEPHKFPGLHSWIENFKKEPVIQENLPTYDELSAAFKAVRLQILASA
ncbi:putative Glutathione s-transferase [Melia azedarach]|uniref:Glutathione s-transferase n=2 Tax=Melia azedarach TaxID=155640 RepID=A0ACC1YJR5_MELAZ|nr:putative Glutathione s-transferase [Melia azedarach]KAJ4722865.1 putative Glutathione s-transferase [Melia azedarach]